MEVSFVDLVAQYEELKEEIDSAVLAVLRSGKYSSGEQVSLLEEELAASCGLKYGIAVNSGTDALKISLQALGIKEGDEVITTPFSFGATIEAILQNGARPVFVDIEPKTFNIAVENLESAITKSSKAILPVHLFGQIAEMEEIREIAKKYDLKIVEDAAQAIGSTRNGLPIGSWGDAAALSFYPTKNLGAAGDGGMILTNDEELTKRAKALRVHGMYKQYFYDEVGHTSRLDEIQAAILRVKFKKLGQWNEARRQHALIYDRFFEGTDVTPPYVLPETTYHNYHQYTIRHPRRDALMAYLTEHGVRSAIYYPSPLHLQKAYAHLGYKEGDFPIAEKTCKEVLSLPIHPHLSREQVEYAADVVCHFVAPKAGV
ncbi:MAG TPA: DegT/DnrJ/EryC1/StrS family aminotransferase [Fimbriimonadales bacterium]|nr:DegT/DnrJ/EryC1/StrS family aminotransferase [Fimbriimonadales bacterium]